MVDVNARFRYNADFGPLQAQIKALTRDIGMLNASFVAMDRAAFATKRSIAESFAANLNATGQFKASFVDLTSATEQFGRALDKRTLGLREYFREARRVYQQDSMASRLAERQVRYRQSQLLDMGTGPGGRRQGMVVTPLKLDTSDFQTKMQLATEKYAIFNRLVDDGATKLINWGKNTQWAGRQLTVGLTMPLVLFGAAVSKTFRDVDKELTRFAKVYGSDLVGANSAATEAMKQQIQSLAVEYARTYGIAAKETAALAADLAATGLEGEKLTGALAQTTRLAVLGEVDRQEAMQTTLALQSAFMQSTKELSDSINFLNAVENQTSASLQDFTAAIPKAGPVVRQLGGDVKDLAVMLTAMREGGIPAAEAANAIKSGLASMINPTKAASERLAKLGVDIEGIVNRNRGELMPTLMEFGGVINQLDSFARAKVIEELFGKYQFARISALFDNLNRQGSQTAQVLDLMGASSADLAKIANKEIGALTESLSMRFTRAVEGFKAALLPIGEVLTSAIIPFIEGATTVIGKMIDVFNALPEPIKNAGKFLLGLTAAAGPLIMLAGVFGNFLGYMTKGILQLNNFTRRLMGLPVEKLEILDDQTIAAAKATDLLTDSFNKEASSLQVLNRQLQNYVANLRAAAASSPGMFVPGSAARPVRRSSGGDIPGYGGGDKVPALLEPGEFVVRKEVAKKNRGFLRAFNSGMVQGFNEGGEARKVFAHTVASEKNEDTGSTKYYGVGFDVDATVNSRLNSPGRNPLTKDEFIAAISSPGSTDTMKALLRRLPGRLTDAQIDLIVDEYKSELIRKIGPGKDTISDPMIYEKTKEILDSGGPGSRLVREGMKIGIDAAAGVSLKKLREMGVKTSGAKKFTSVSDLQRELKITPPSERPEPGTVPPGKWAYQYIGKTDSHPAYLLQREIESKGWGEGYSVYQVNDDNSLSRLGRSKAGERDPSRYKPFTVEEPRFVDPRRRPPAGAVPPPPPSSGGMPGRGRTRMGGAYGFIGHRGEGIYPFSAFGEAGFKVDSQGNVTPIKVSDEPLVIDDEDRNRTSPMQGRRMMGSSLMNVGFAGSMLAGLTAMNGEVTAATTALTAFTTALMVAGTAMEVGQMFGGRGKGRGPGPGFLGLGRAGAAVSARGGAMRAAGAGSGGIGGFLKSGAGMGMMGAGRALAMAGGPWGMAIAAALAVAVAGFVQFNRILENMRQSAKAAFAEATQSAEYFGIELGRNAERAQEFGEIVESLGMTASATADQLDQELVQRVGSDYESLISRLKGANNADIVANDLKLAYSSMIAQGFGEDEAIAIVEEVARQAEQRPIFLNIKGELQMVGEDPEKVAKSIAENSAKGLQLARTFVGQNLQEELKGQYLDSAVRDFTGFDFVDDLFGGAEGQFLDFAGAWDGTIERLQRAVDPTKRLSVEMQAALSTVTNAGEMFGASMNTLFEQFKQFPSETGPAIQTVLGYVEQLDEGQREAFDTAVAKNFTENVADPALLLFYEQLGTTNEDLALKMKLAQAASLGLSDGLSGLMAQGKLTAGAVEELIQKVILLDNLNVNMDAEIDSGIQALKKQSREASAAYEDKIKAEEKYIKKLDKEAETAQENHEDYMDSLEDEARALDDRAEKIQENAEKQQDLIDKKIKSLQVDQESASFEQQQRERAFGMLGALMSGDAGAFEQARLDYVQAQEDRQRELAIQGLEDRKEKIAEEAEAKLDAIEKEKKAIDDRARAAQEAHEAYMEQNQENQEEAEKRIAKIEKEKNQTEKTIQKQINLLEEYKAQGFLTEQQVKDINTKLQKMGERLPAGVRTAVEKISKEMFGPNGDYTKIVNGLVEEMATALNVSPEEVRNMLGTTLTGQYGQTGGSNNQYGSGPGGAPDPTQTFNTGGKVEGPGTQTSDSIMARLSRGEYVVRASAVNKIGTKALDHMNATGQIPGYAQGSPGGVNPDQQAGGFWGTGPNAMTILSIKALESLYGQTVANIRNNQGTATPGAIPAGEGSQWLANFLSAMGLSGEQLRVAYAIAMRESSGRPNLVSTMDGNGYGLFQIQFGVGHANTLNTVLGSSVTDNESDRQKFAQLMFDPQNNFKVMMHMSKNMEDLGAWGLNSWRNPSLNTRDYANWTASQHQSWIMEPFLRYYNSFPGVNANFSGAAMPGGVTTGTVQGGSQAPGPAGAGRTLSGWPAIPPAVAGSYLAMTNSPHSSREFYVAKWAVPIFESLMQAWQTHPSLGQGRLNLNSGSSGGYHYRMARAANGWSDHAAGAAVDFRYDILPAFSGYQMTSSERSAVAQILGGPLGRVFGWGGNYGMAYMDEMHFYLKPSGGVIPSFANGGFVDGIPGLYRGGAAEVAMHLAGRRSGRKSTTPEQEKKRGKDLKRFFNGGLYGGTADRQEGYSYTKPSSTKPKATTSYTYTPTADRATVMASPRMYSKMSAYSTSSQVQDYLYNKYVKKYGPTSREEYDRAILSNRSSSNVGGKRWQTLLSMYGNLSEMGAFKRQGISLAARGIPDFNYWRTLSREQKEWFMQYGPDAQWSGEKTFKVMPYLYPQATVRGNNSGNIPTSRLNPSQDRGWYMDWLYNQPQVTNGPWPVSMSSADPEKPGFFDWAFNDVIRPGAAAALEFVSLPLMAASSISPLGSYYMDVAQARLAGVSVEEWRQRSTGENLLDAALFASTFIPGVGWVARGAGMGAKAAGAGARAAGTGAKALPGPKGLVRPGSGARGARPRPAAGAGTMNWSARVQRVNSLRGNIPASKQARFDALINLARNPGTAAEGMTALRMAARLAGAKRFAGGGRSPDDILARVSRGEYIMSAPAVSAIGINNMDMINQGRLPGFNVGGFVGDPRFKLPKKKSLSNISESKTSTIRQGTNIEYNINIDVAQTDASADDIANRVMRTLKSNENSRRLRSNG